jgi:radical SAM superfamily enzyme YgiQ (UPF0313 family)
MRVLVVSPNQTRSPDPVPPIGAAYAAAAARRAGHEVALYDACFAGERLHDELALRIGEFRPDVVGLSLRNVDDTAYPRAASSVPLYRAVADTIRAAAPSAPLVLGGSAFTLFPRELMEALGADHGIAGEAETRLPELLAAIESGGARRGDVQGVAVSDLADLPAPARDLLDLRRYAREGGSVNLQTKRGCVFACGYCTYPDLEGRRVRARPPVAVVDEMERVLREDGIDSFFFVDSVFNVPSEHARSICLEIARRGLSVRWTAYATPAAITAELVDAMARSGCKSVDLGTDAASAATLSGLGKGFDVGDIRRASALLRGAGIPFCHSLLFGGPGETWDTFAETVANVVETQPAAVVAIAGVRVYPRTRIAAHAIAHGVPAASIGLDPVFWIEPAVREGLLERLAAVHARHPSWIVPGVTPEVPEPLRKRLRARGARGPLWEQLGRGEPAEP